MPEPANRPKHPAEHIIQLSRLPVPSAFPRSHQERAIGDAMLILNTQFLRGMPKARESAREGLIRLGFVQDDTSAYRP